MAEPLEDAVESDDKKVALIIAILALFLALAEAGGKECRTSIDRAKYRGVRPLQLLPSQEASIDRDRDGAPETWRLPLLR